MSKRDEFITVIRTLRAASPTITDKQHIGLLRQAVQQYELSLENAKQILKDSGLVIGESVNYFEVLEISVDDFTKSKAPRVVRGGSWHSPVQDLRVANRNTDRPKLTTSIIGFRCVMDVTP